MIRSLFFNILFYLGTFFISFFGLPFLIFKAAGFSIARLWTRWVMWVLKVTVKITYKIEGVIPKGPILILSKHQSAWETIIFNILIDRPAYILKEELMWIPLFGAYLKATKMIALDRKGTLQALKKLIRDGKSIIESGRSIVMFPEGTRSAPGEEGHYKKGAYLMYKNLNVAALPVALNSGVFWPRRTFMKYPGQITMKFLKPIPPGLKEDEFMRCLTSSIEKESQNLFNQVKN